MRYVKRRRPSPTNPPTFTAGEVCSILKGRLDPISLQRMDLSGLFRPSYYYWTSGQGGLIEPNRRDELVAESGPSRGDPRRRYTYQDLVWLRLLLYVKEGLMEAGVKRPSHQAAQAIDRLRAICDGRCPSAARVILAGRGVYLLRDHGVAEPLTGGTQLSMSAVLTDTVFAELEGRIAVLQAREELRDLPSLDPAAVGRP